MLSFELISLHQFNPVRPQGEHRDTGRLLENVMLNKNDEFAHCSVSYFVLFF